jgi:hypothetical protein
MNHQRNPQADAVAQVRTLLVAAARRANQVKSAAEQTLDCLAAFSGILSRIGEPAARHDLSAVAGAAKYAVAVCRGAQALLRSLDALGKWPAVVTAEVPSVAATPSAH